MRINRQIFSLVLAATLLVAVGFAYFEYQLVDSRLKNAALKEALHGASTLAGKSEFVLDSLFRPGKRRSPWVLAHGVVRRGKEGLSTNTRGGQVDRARLEKLVDESTYALSAFRWSESEMLFIKQQSADRWGWIVARFVPVLMNLSLDSNPKNMRLLVNQKGQVLGSDPASNNSFHRSFISKLRAYSTDRIQRADKIYVRSVAPVPRSNLFAVSVSLQEKMSDMQLYKIAIRFFAVVILGVLIALRIVSSLKNLKKNLVKSFEGQNVELDWEWRQIVSHVRQRSAKSQLANTKASVEASVEKPDSAAASVAALQENKPAKPRPVSEEELKKSLAGFVNQIKKPVVSLLVQTRLLKAGASAGKLEKVAAETRQIRELLDLYSLYSVAEKYEKQQGVDLAVFFQELKEKHSEEFTSDQLSFQLETSEGMYVRGSETHLRTICEFLFRELRRNSRLKVGWSLKRENKTGTLVFRDLNGQISAEEWELLSRCGPAGPRSFELTLAFFALKGSMSYFGATTSIDRTQDGYELKMDVPLLDHDTYSQLNEGKEQTARVEPKSLRGSEEEEQDLDGDTVAMDDNSTSEDWSIRSHTQGDQVNEEDFEEVTAEVTAVVADSFESLYQEPQPSQSEEAAEMLLREHQESSVETHSEEQQDSPSTKTNDLAPGDLPDKNLIKKRRRKIDDYQVSVRGAKRGDVEF